MAKTSLKIFFLFSLAIIAFCVSLGDAREITKVEVNCIGGKCPDGKKNCNCLPPITPTMKVEVNCIDGKCLGGKKNCNCLPPITLTLKTEVNCIGGKCPDGKKNCNCLSPITPTMDTYETNASCHKDNECLKYCPKGCKIVNCNFGTCYCEC